MSQSSLGHKDDKRVISRRSLVIGGFSTAAAATATFMAARSGTTAVTPMDVKRPAFSPMSAPVKISQESTDTEK